MAGWREIKRSALKDIHETFEIPVVYLTSATAVPIRANVRLHQRGTVSETTLAAWGNAASLLDMTDRLVFTGREIKNVLQKSYVIFGKEECFFTGPSRPIREGYTVVEVTPVEKEKLAEFISKLDLNHAAYEGILT